MTERLNLNASNFKKLEKFLFELKLPQRIKHHHVCGKD